MRAKPTFRQSATDADNRVKASVAGVYLQDQVTFSPKLQAIVGVHGSGREDVCRALFGAEPTTAGEILMDGNHDIAACEAATGHTLAELYEQMAAHRIELPGTLDGGDVLKHGGMVWVGRGGRTNDEGIAQLSRLAHVRERSLGTLDITVERNVARERLEESRAEHGSGVPRGTSMTSS